MILTESGRAFCAGADLKAHRDRPQSAQERRRYTHLGQRVNHLIQSTGTPVVAAVNGHAIGAGLELALSADFAIVAEDARLRLPEVNPLFVYPDRVVPVDARVVLGGVGSAGYNPADRRGCPMCSKPYPGLGWDRRAHVSAKRRLR